MNRTGDFLACPRQGELHVEYCLGCAHRIDVEQYRDTTVVRCRPGGGTGGPLWEPLRTPPAAFRLYDDEPIHT